MRRGTGRTSRRLRVLATLICTALSASACGGGDEEGRKQAAGDLGEYCSATLAIETAQSDIDFQSLSPEQPLPGPPHFTRGMKAEFNVT